MQTPSLACPSVPIRVLVADDDPIQRSEIASRLIRLNGQAIEAEDGSKAWSLLATHGFDVAIVDLNMPNLDGFALIRCMRGFPRTRHVPIVVVSSSNDSGSMRDALEAGATSFLVKPIAWSMFEQHIGFLLRLIQNASIAEKAGLAPHSGLIGGDTAKPVISRPIEMTGSAVKPAAHIDAAATKPALAAMGTRPADLDPIVDLACLAAFVGDRSLERVPRTISIFVEELEKKAGQLADLVADKNVAALQMLAHSFFGSSAMLGAERLAKLSRSVENSCRNAAAVDWEVVHELLVTTRDTIIAFDALKSKDAIAMAIGRVGKAA